MLKYVMVSSEVVWPDQTDVIALEPGHDILTLLTCDPPPVNDHRLLVRAERSPITDAEVAAINPDLVAPDAVTAAEASDVAGGFAPRDLWSAVLTARWGPLAGAVGLGLAVVLVVALARRRRRAEEDAAAEAADSSA
ncbi:sortase [Propioniciclava soli]|uniref:Sortase n=1 Tax=Propioniciclava soli TaxID=2775081 RepID=A0ABZ3C890_9ACTN